MMSTEFPIATDDDPGDVALALQTANALWKQGDAADALRWLSRAAEAAEGEGKDDRALSLARVAAELRDSAGVNSTPPPPPSRRAPSLPAPPPRVGLPPAVAKATNLDDIPTPAHGAALPAPPLAPPPPPAQAHEAPASAPTPAAPPVSAPRPSAAPAPTQARPSSAPSVAPKPADTRTALRVAVEVLSSQSGTLMVRILGEGEAIPSGAQEALLVPTGPGVDLRRLPSRRG